MESLWGWRKRILKEHGSFLAGSGKDGAEDVCRGI